MAKSPLRLRFAWLIEGSNQVLFPIPFGVRLYHIAINCLIFWYKLLRTRIDNDNTLCVCRLVRLCQEFPYLFVTVIQGKARKGNFVCSFQNGLSSGKNIFNDWVIIQLPGWPNEEGRRNESAFGTATTR